MPQPVPTALQLAAMGPEYAVVVEQSKVSAVVRVTAKGHAHLGQIMRANALEAVARGAGDWYPDPPHTRLHEPEESA